MATKTGGRDFRKEAELRRADIDRLIDAYDTPGTRKGPEVIDVDCFPGEIKFATAGPDGRLHYRGRVLRCIKKRSKSAARHLKEVHGDVLEMMRKGEVSA